MKRMLKIAAAVTVLVAMTMVDAPFLPLDLVPEAQAILGVRRRTAVVAYSAGAARGSAAAAASAQQAAAAQQQAAAAQAAAGVPVGTVVPALPQGCKAVTVSGTEYQECSGSFYRAAFQGNSLVYVVVKSPL